MRAERPAGMVGNSVCLKPDGNERKEREEHDRVALNKLNMSVSETGTRYCY